MNVQLDNKTVQVETGGKPHDPSKPTIAFIHGAGMDHTIWSLQSRYFAHHGYSVLAIDLPGHGGSEGPPLSSIEEMADWIQGLVQTLSPNPIGLIGHSMGALVALETAAQYPGLVIALGLIGISVPMPVNADLLAKTQNDIPAAVKLIVTWAFGRRAHIGGTQTPGLWMLGGGRQLLLKSSDGQLYADFQACNNYAYGLQAAAKIKCPTLLVAGSDDRMTPPRSVENLGQNIKNSKTTIIPSAGHMMMIEEPDLMLKTLSEFSSSHIGAN